MNVIKSLKLPTTYKTRISVSGYINIDHVDLKCLASGTAGHVVVYAKRINWGRWEEIPVNVFRQAGRAILEA